MQNGAGNYWMLVARVPVGLCGRLRFSSRPSPADITHAECHVNVSQRTLRVGLPHAVPCMRTATELHGNYRTPAWGGREL